ncbi:MAG: DNA recombination protein RmuC [Bacteroidales bacterium]|nr:DNA recombination protein RmuC [Bacteroidales bacterium]
MNNTEIILIALCAFLLVAGIILLVFCVKFAKGHHNLIRLTVENENLNKDLSKTKSEKEGDSKTIESLREIVNSQEVEIAKKGQELASQQSRYQQLEQAYKDYQNSFEKLAEKNDEHLQLITSQILEEKSKKFTETNSQEIENLLKPLKQEISDFKERINQSSITQGELHASLRTQIEEIVKQTKSISEDAVNLTNALKGENKRAGNWGELTLETILENSGLIKDIHYKKQEQYINKNGVKEIPDFIIFFPSDEPGSQESIVIDSKVSLVAYERYYNADGNEVKTKCLKEHLASVRSHIDELAKKDYAELTPGNIDFVMMFMPVESAYLLAMQSDPSLWEDAYKKKVVLISATNLISSLRLIADMWKIDTRNKEAQSMAEICSNIYDKMLNFLQSFDQVGKNLEDAVASYQTATGQLNQGKGNVIKQLKDLSEKGINVKAIKQTGKGYVNKSIPDRFLNELTDGD